MSAPVEIDADLLAGWPLPDIPADGDKTDRGRVLAVGGGAAAFGAVLLTGLAALRAGAGRLQMAVPARMAAALAVAAPEARIFQAKETEAGDIAGEAAADLVEAARRCDALAVGPGLLDEGEAGRLARGLFAAEASVFLLDAAAMTGLAGDPAAARPAAGRLVLTPHAGEMAALLGIGKAEVRADPLAAARRAAASFQAVVVMKGAETFVVSPEGAAWRHAFGPPGLGACGSGDVLAGVIAGLAARGASPAQAAAWGVYVHGQAGVRLSRRIGPLGFLAREILDEIPGVLAELDARRGGSAQAVYDTRAHAGGRAGGEAR